MQCSELYYNLLTLCALLEQENTTCKLQDNKTTSITTTDIALIWTNMVIIALISVILWKTQTTKNEEILQKGQEIETAR